MFDSYEFKAIVMQCGADSLYGDPIESTDPFNLTVDGYCRCVQLILDSRIPTIFLGGGKSSHNHFLTLYFSTINHFSNKVGTIFRILLVCGAV